ncbi:hypothetical protein [Streptomyces sp. NPDC006446]
MTGHGSFGGTTETVAAPAFGPKPRKPFVDENVDQGALRGREHPG